MKNVSGFSRCGLDVATVNRIFPRTSRVAGNVETRFVATRGQHRVSIRIRVCLQAYRNSVKNVSGFSRCGLDVATVNRIFPRPRESRATSRLDSSQLVRNFETDSIRIRVCLQAYRNSMKNVSGFSRCGLDVATVNRIFPRPRESWVTSRLDFVSGYAFRHTVIR